MGSKTRNPPYKRNAKSRSRRKFYKLRRERLMREQMKADSTIVEPVDEAMAEVSNSTTTAASCSKSFTRKDYSSSLPRLLKGPICDVQICQHRDDRTTCRFLKLPKHEATFELWLSFFKPGECPVRGNYICTCHFKDSVSVKPSKTWPSRKDCDKIEYVVPKQQRVNNVLPEPKKPKPDPILSHLPSAVKAALYACQECWIPGCEHTILHKNVCKKFWPFPSTYTPSFYVWMEQIGNYHIPAEILKVCSCHFYVKGTIKDNQPVQNLGSVKDRIKAQLEGKVHPRCWVTTCKCYATQCRLVPLPKTPEDLYYWSSPRHYELPTDRSFVCGCHVKNGFYHLGPTSKLPSAKYWKDLLRESFHLKNHPEAEKDKNVPNDIPLNGAHEAESQEDASSSCSNRVVAEERSKPSSSSISATGDGEKNRPQNRIEIVDLGKGPVNSETLKNLSSKPSTVMLKVPPALASSMKGNRCSIRVMKLKDVPIAWRKQFKMNPHKESAAGLKRFIYVNSDTKSVKILTSVKKSVPSVSQNSEVSPASDGVQNVVSNVTNSEDVNNRKSSASEAPAQVDIIDLVDDSSDVRTSSSNTIEVCGDPLVEQTNIQVAKNPSDQTAKTTEISGPFRATDLNTCLDAPYVELYADVKAEPSVFFDAERASFCTENSLKEESS